MGEQVPFRAPFFAALQAEQRPEQALLQQTPSTQMLLKHSAFVAHCWPFASTHLPEPLQSWMPPQDGSASVPPLGMFAQTPRLPGSAQLLHSSVQALEQQTPSTQLPEVHSFEVPHIRPFAFFGEHAMPVQKFPVAQSVSAVHVRLQMPPLHAKALQLCVPPSMHWPTPLQVSGFDSVFWPEQEATAQVVPFV